MKTNNSWMIIFVLALATMAVVISLSGNPGVDSANIVNGTIQIEDMDFENAPFDEACVTYDMATSRLEFRDCEDALNHYGNIYASDAATGAQVLATAGAFEVIDALDIAGISSTSVIVDTGDHDITVDVSGVYLVEYSLSFEGTSNKEFNIAVFDDGVIDIPSETVRFMSAGDKGVVSSAYITTFVAGDVIDLRAAPETNGDSITVYFGSLSVEHLHD